MRYRTTITNKEDNSKGYLDYVWVDSKLVSISFTSDELNQTVKYLYNDSGSPVGFIATREDGSVDTFYYLKNAQGDITHIVSAAGKKMVSFTYDAFGKRTVTYQANNSTTPGQIELLTQMKADLLNPFAYRGYCYDYDMGMYYLQSRYYDPSTGRFINSDSTDYLNYTGTVLGCNLFAYCENDPVNKADPRGCVASNIIGLVIAGVIGAVGGYYLSTWLANKISFKKDWQRKAFIGGLTALVTASAAAIGYFIGPYVAKIWYSIQAKLSGLVRGLFKGIKNIASSKMNHINTSKHLWNRVLGKQASSVNIKNLIYRAIKNGQWKVLSNGTIGIHWWYKGKLIEITGKVVNGIFNVGNAWVWNGVSKKLW